MGGWGEGVPGRGHSWVKTGRKEKGPEPWGQTRDPFGPSQGPWEAAEKAGLDVASSQTRAWLPAASPWASLPLGSVDIHAVSKDGSGDVTPLPQSL